MPLESAVDHNKTMTKMKSLDFEYEQVQICQIIV